MTIQEYIAEVQKQFATGIAREHTYRPALQQLLATMLPYLTVSNESARQSCGAPDYILMRDNYIPVAFVEAKDIDDNDLAGKKEHKEQFDRYRSSLDNIVFTDYLDFRFYEKGEFVDSIRIAEVRGGKIVAHKDNFEKFKSLIEHFGNAAPQVIMSSSKLAEIMAGKARLLANVIERVLVKEEDDDGNLKGQMDAFRNILIHNISPKDFADVYAQTITYGMFAARLHDPTPETFSRSEAATLIPKTNPFLRQLFQYIAGYDLDERISWIVDDLAETFRATDMPKIMLGFGKRTAQNDPMIHFYEDFLSAYDPNLRKSRGVWYTPQAVVNFIVRAVDDILQKEFGLPMGLADTSKVTIDQSVEQSHDKRYSDGKKKLKIELHRVQILDPATGTGTFLAEVVSRIHCKFQGQAGMWQGYIDEHPLPRLNGFELLMAPYAMAHLKIDQLLTETGYKSVNNKRLRIFLTNSLEKYHKDTGTLFAQFLAREANGANAIKRDAPVMVVIGNPPYSVSSSNKGEWITNLLAEYKKDLKERNIQPLSDDYIKFIRYGQYFIDKNKEGILAYISNNSFIDGLIHRQMRKSLINSFDKIYILNLHGDSKKKEKSPDGGKDENVFNIMQGVSINIFIRTNHKSSKPADIFYYDIFGKRKSKFEYLFSHSIDNVPWENINIDNTNFFFAPKNFEQRNDYEKGFKIDELFIDSSVGISTSKDSVNLWNTPQEVARMVADIIELDEETFRQKYNVGNDSRDWSIKRAKADVGKKINHNKIIPISYLPFDKKYLYYTGLTNGIVAWPRFRSLGSMLLGENIGIVVPRQTTQDWRHIFISDKIINGNFTSSARLLGAGQLFPLWKKDTTGNTDMFDNAKFLPNFKTELVEKISKCIGLTFELEKSGDTDKFAPIDLLDYIYALLHSPAYREKYKEFLKTDFPRVPYPTSADEFRRLAEIGSELRRIHLMKHSELDNFITQYPVSGSNAVDKVRWDALSTETGRVWINSEQYFDNVPSTAWTFYIGGYQPAQKWLKDRTGRVLGFDDIFHYQRIIKALVMTNEIMKKIDC